MSIWEKLVTAALSAIIVVSLSIAGNVNGQSLTLTGSGSGSRGGYIGVGDIVSWNRYCGLMAYSTADLTGSVAAVRVRRASDSTEQDINILTDGEFDSATAATFGAATTLHVRTCYNRGTLGATHDYIQTTAGNQPQLILNGIGSRPYIQSTVSSQILVSANTVTPATGNVSLLSFGARTSGTNTCNSLIRENGPGNRMTITSTGARSLLGGTSGTITGGVISNGVFTANVGVITGDASSALYTNTTATAGTAVGSTTAAAPSFLAGGTTTTCAATLGGDIDNVILTPAQARTIATILRSRYGV